MTAPEALISFSLNVPAHRSTAYLLGSCSEIELNRIFSMGFGASAPCLTYDRRAATVCRISLAVKGSRGCARLAGMDLVDDVVVETILTVIALN